MKKCRLVVTLLIFCVALSSVGATTIDEIIEAAKNYSVSYQNVLLSYSNGLMSIEALEKEKTVGVSVEATVNPLVGAGTDEMGISASPSVSITLPDDDTTITGSLSVATKYNGNDTTVSGNVGVSHTFDFNAYDSTYADNLSYLSTKYSTEMSYKSAELNFEKSVLSMVSQILSMESSLLQSKYNVEKQQAALDKLDALGTYSEDSPTYISAQNVLTSYEQSLGALQDQYNSLLVSYTAMTGLDWDGVEVGAVPDLVFETEADGNTSLKLEEMSAQSSEESYKSALAQANKSDLSTNLVVSADSSNSYSVSGSATYNSNNWHVSVTPSVSITSGDVTPQLTIAGSWSNTAKSDNSVNSALNSAKMAANNYIEALSSYNDSVSSYALQVLQYENKQTQTEADLAYKKMLLDNEQNLYDLGLSTDDSLRSAQIDYEVAQNEWKQFVLEGMSLQRDLDVFML